YLRQQAIRGLLGARGHAEQPYPGSRQHSEDRQGDQHLHQSEALASRMAGRHHIAARRKTVSLARPGPPPGAATRISICWIRLSGDGRVSRVQVQERPPFTSIPVAVPNGGGTGSVSVATATLPATICAIAWS